MKIKFQIVLVTILSSLVFSSTASSLTLTQFKSICKSSDLACTEHPILQAYIGGALDLVAMLDEETKYLGQLYCEEPSVLFDVPRIIDYMLAQKLEYGSRNAMLVLIQYLEEHGNCA